MTKQTGITTPRADALQHKQAHRDWNPESSKPVDHPAQIAEWVRLTREIERELGAINEAALRIVANVCPDKKHEALWREFRAALRAVSVQDNRKEDA